MLYAPGLNDTEDIRRLVDAVDLPVNVLALPGHRAGRRAGRDRASSGSRSAAGSAASPPARSPTAGRELLEQGTYDFWAIAVPGMAVSFEAFS